MDGITSALLLRKSLESIGGRNIDCYIPDRRDEGYGLSFEGIDIAKSNGVNLLVTVDCGSTSISEVEYCHENDIEVIITDHHEIKEQIPDCPVINPKLNGLGYRYLAGAGVAFKLVNELFAGICGDSIEEWTERISEIPVLAMIGTISDRVPQLDENRILIFEGNNYLHKTDDPAITVLRNKGDIGVAIEPLYSGTKNLSWDFLTSNSINEALGIYSELEIKHTLWSIKARENFDDLKKQLNEGHLVLFEPDLQQKYAGSVANRARDYTGYPVFVIYMVGEKIRGEGRGPDDYNLLQLLNSVDDLLIDYGGHKPACGFTLKEESIEEFRERVEPLLKQYEAITRYDSEINIEEVNEDLMKLVENMKPFGKDNYTPVFLIKDVDYYLENNTPYIEKGGSRLRIDIMGENPPPSRRVDAYLRVDGNFLEIIKWDWVD